MATTTRAAILMELGPLVINPAGEVRKVKVGAALKEASRVYGYRKPLQTFSMMERGPGPRRNIERPGA